jgi:hypothetical protein
MQEIFLVKVKVNVRFVNNETGQFSFQYRANAKRLDNQPVLPTNIQYERKYELALKRFLKKRFPNEAKEATSQIADTTTTTSLTATSGCGAGYRCRSCPCKNTDGDYCGGKPPKICVLEKYTDDKHMKAACTSMALDFYTKCGSGDTCNC